MGKAYDAESLTPVFHIRTNHNSRKNKFFYQNCAVALSFLCDWYVLMEFGQLRLWTSWGRIQIVYKMNQQERFLSALGDIGWWLRLRYQAHVLEGRGVRHTAV